MAAPGSLYAQTSHSAVPPGFESLMLEQTSQIDVYFGGRFIYSGLATFDPNSVTFHDPEALAARIPGLINPQSVVEQLSAPMATNESLRCVLRQQTNCGVMYPPVAEVIFDGRSFRADLFVAPELLALQELRVQPFLDPSSAGFSVFQNLGIAVVGDDQSSQMGQNINSRTLFSLGENFLQITSNYSNDRDFQIDNFNFQRDWAGMRYQAGMVSTSSDNLQFASAFNLLGITASTALDTREDLRFATGNTLEVFLPLRARVSIYKDGRLMVSNTYESGNQQLDTSVLPGGSYEVEIRILDDQGERIETRFYTKNSRLPPRGAPQHSLSLGFIQEPNPTSVASSTGDYIWRASYSSRFTDSAAFRVGATGTGAAQLIEGGWFLIQPRYELGLDAAITDSGNGGVSADLTLVLDNMSVSSSFRQVWNDAPDNAPAASNLLGRQSSQWQTSLSMPLLSGSLSLSSRINTREADEAVRSINLGYRFPVWMRLGSRISSRFNIARQDGLTSFLLNLTLRRDVGEWRISQNTDLSGRELLAGGTEQIGQVALSGNWQSPRDWQSQMVVGLRANHSSQDQSNLTADMDWRGNAGQARMQVDQVIASSGNRASYSGRYDTSLVMAGSAFAFGGREQQRSALLIDLRGSRTPDAYFNVLVDGRSRGVAQPGKTTLIPLSPYRSYEVRLESAGLGFVSFENRTERATLYPGNAVALAWDIKEIHVIFGRVLDTSGAPVANAVLHGVEGLAVTDGNGNFQAELATDVKQLEVETRTARCRVEVPEYSLRRGIGILDDMVCSLQLKGASPVPPEAVTATQSLPPFAKEISISVDRGALPFSADARAESAVRASAYGANTRALNWPGNQAE